MSLELVRNLDLIYDEYNKIIEDGNGGDDEDSIAFLNCLISESINKDIDYIRKKNIKANKEDYLRLNNDDDNNNNNNININRGYNGNYNYNSKENSKSTFNISMHLNDEEFVNDNIIGDGKIGGKMNGLHDNRDSYMMEMREIKNRVSKLGYEVERRRFEGNYVLREVQEREAREITEREDKEREEEKKEGIEGDDGEDKVEVIKKEGDKEENELNQLRKRLLSSSNRKKLKEMNLQGEGKGEKNIDNENEMHDNLQNKLIGEMLSFVNNLKESSMKFSDKLKEDEEYLKLSTKSIENTHLKLNTVSGRLDKFSKDGKITIWFILYASVFVIVGPLIAIFIISVVRRF
ncbi:uncharacterized protein ASCRUDRAFT_6027 [Ascoidea rubescens DSM 1968]|uniref:Uncharacterized protein n=1 Tax=Ascoidea rubescens DSM 1968 TaxID=1344418 RepID=A0A1D2VRE0_9ASCO|nr:hypothetical protein ASCRUDRAFT_6027 [Ascoidea rubescens DSM 1968]ODV64159.1 hypothetical protein ASCRUDRAFT_6027 [Ascoidea rubescens DSM 1968]